MSYIEVPERVEELIDISVVVPIFNERNNVEELAGRIDEILSAQKLEYEIIFVDDGSTDCVESVFGDLCNKHSTLRIIYLSRNFGQHPAMLAGLKYARGRIIITMDGDLQNDPGDIPMFISEMKKGYDLVLGHRRERNVELLSRRIPSLIANYIFKKITKTNLRDYGCNYKAFTREMAQIAINSGNMRKYAIFFLIWKGANFTEIEISDSPRRGGSSKYNFFKLARLFLDVFIIFSTQPYMLVFLTLLGLVGIALGTSIFAIITISGIIYQAKLNTNLLLLSLLLLFLGVQFITTAILNERITHINERVQQRPLFYVRKITKQQQKAMAGLNE